MAVGPSPSPATPTPPTKRPFLKSGTPPGLPANPPVTGAGTGTIAVPGVLLKTITLPGPLNLLISENDRLEKFTPTSGPGGLFCTPGGKFCCTIKPAVRDVKAC